AAANWHPPLPGRLPYVTMTSGRPIPLSGNDRSERPLFQPKDIGAATVEGIGQRERDATAGALGLRAPRRRWRIGQAQHSRMLVGVLTLEDEDRAIRHPRVGDHRFGLVSGVEKKLAKLVGGGNNLVGVHVRVDRGTPQNGDLDQLLRLVAENVRDPAWTGA